MLAESGGIDPHAVAGTIRFQNSDGDPAASLSLLAFSGRLELPEISAKMTSDVFNVPHSIWSHERECKPNQFGDESQCQGKIETY